MKRRIILSIALALSVVLLSLHSSDSTAKAARTRSYVADTGLITLGPNQLLRLTVAPAPGPQEHITFVYGSLEYMTRSSCDGGVCILFASIPAATRTVTLMPGEAASIDITQTPGVSAVRGTLRGTNPDIPLNAIIIDTDTSAAKGNIEFVWKVESAEQ